MIPTIIEHAGYKDYAYDIYSHLLNNRIIFLSGEINDYVSNLVVSELLYLDSISNDEISLYINSPGGSVTSGLAIYDTMKFIKSDVRTICVGLAASMAAVILAAGKYGKRNALENSEVMIHAPSGYMGGKSDEVTLSAKRLAKFKDKLIDILVNNSNKSKGQIAKYFNYDKFMNAEETLAFGIVDKIIKSS